MITLLVAALASVITTAALAHDTVLTTVSGELRLSRNETAMQCVASLNARPIHTLNCSGAFVPRVLGRFAAYPSQDAELVVLQESPMGNACNGGPLHFIALSRREPPLISAPLDFCGGKAPLRKRLGNTILITLPGGPVNRGAGTVPTERWRYQKGKVERIQ
jgi:hypothetical protein